MVAAMAAMAVLEAQQEISAVGAALVDTLGMEEQEGQVLLVRGLMAVAAAEVVVVEVALQMQGRGEEYFF
jgi:hypothetical protein